MENSFLVLFGLVCFEFIICFFGFMIFITTYAKKIEKLEANQRDLRYELIEYRSREKEMRKGK